MLVTRRDPFSAAPVAMPGASRPSGARRVKAAEGSFDQITLSAGQAASPTFRALAASLSQQVRTFNTTGKIQDLHRQVQTGEYAVSPREIAARMLLMEEDA